MESDNGPIQASGSLQGTKILLLAEHDSVGGAFRFLENLVELLVAEGASVDLLSARDETLFSTIGPIDKERIRLHSWTHQSSVADFTTGWLRFLKPLRYLLEARAINRYVSRNKLDPTFIIASVCSPGRFLAVRHKYSRVFQFHHTYLRGIGHRLAGPVFGFLAKQQRTILVGVSSFVSDKLSSTWRISGSSLVRTIYNSAGGLIERGARRPSKFPLKVLTVGAMNVAKNPHRFLDVAKHLNCRDDRNLYHFTWIGSGPLEEEVRKRVREEALENIVTLAGHSDEPMSHYLKCDIYLQLSRFDSLPYSLLDAMRLGLPCIVSDVGGLPEMVGDGAPGNVVAASSEIQETVEMLQSLRDPAAREYLGNKMRHEYEVKFSPKVWRQQILELLSA